MSLEKRSAQSEAGDVGSHLSTEDLGAGGGGGCFRKPILASSGKNGSEVTGVVLRRPVEKLLERLG